VRELLEFASWLNYLGFKTHFIFVVVVMMALLIYLGRTGSQDCGRINQGPHLVDDGWTKYLLICFGSNVVDLSGTVLGDIAWSATFVAPPLAAAGVDAEAAWDD